MTPRYVLTSGSITFFLYGDVTPERIHAEQQVLDHRRRQLGGM